MLAFKIMDDPFVGSITFCRIYSGKLETGMGLLNSTRDKRERVGRMLLMHSNNREDIEEAFAGDIVALAGMKDTTTGDTLCDPAKPIILERMEFPEPVIEVAIEPKTKSDQEKLGTAIQKLAEEDPTFKVHQDDETGQTVIGGMGGEQCFKHLRELDPNVRAIVASGYDNDDIASKFLDQGFCGYLTKPYRVSDLTGLIGQCTSSAPGVARGGLRSA